MISCTFNSSSTRAHRPYLQFLRQHFPAAAALVRRAPELVSIVLVGDRTMAALHERFLRIAGPTDVLTFEMEHDRRGRCTEGEIVVCVPHARRQARFSGHDLRHEILLYTLHGLLHLSGYDDQTEADFVAIHAAEDRILRSIGIGNVFTKVKR